jgi:hypothetical protein
MKARKFRKIPVVIEAMLWDGTAAGATEIIDWVLSEGGTATYTCDGPGCQGESDHYLSITTLEGRMAARPGYYIIRGVEGEFYGCEPNIFHKTYGPA